jgi:hypothetical protein
MGLDAVVYCDCFERGRLREPPPPGCHLSVASDGSVLCGSDDLEVQLAFDQWQLLRACAHELGVLMHRRIGNIALVEALGDELRQQAERFPLLLSKVLQNGTHCGDFIPVGQVDQLRPEVDALTSLRCARPQRIAAVREFAQQMRDLIGCALAVGKPIAF